MTSKGYWMFLNKERSDYTVYFIVGDCEKAEIDKLISSLSITISNRGSLIAAEPQENGAIEIWIKDPIDEEAYMYMLFKCDDFIVEI